MQAQLVTIEGNIGTGKTTIAKKVAAYMPDTQFFAAPDPDTNPHWKAFQAEPKKHALAMQLWFLRQRLRVYVAALQHLEEKRESVILDFSIWSDSIFAEMHLEQGFLTPDEHRKYQDLERRILNLGLPPPHISIVLHAAPEVCLERCQETRKSTGLGSANSLMSNLSSDLGDSTSLPYLKRVDELYQQVWLSDMSKVWPKSGRALAGRVADAVDAGLTPAPSLLVLMRDWSDPSALERSTAIADAVMCGEPHDVDAWLCGCKLSELDEKAGAIVGGRRISNER